MTRRGVILRAAGMLGAISAMVVGATFALTGLQSELTNVTFSSTTQDLKVAADCSTFTAVDDTSLNISNLTEGADYVSANAKPFCLKDTDPLNNLSISMMADMSTAVSSGGFDASKVDVRVIDITTGNTVTDTTLLALETGEVVLNGVDGGTHLAAGGGTDHFTINFKLLPGAVPADTNTASITHLGLIFTGTPHAV